MGYRKIIFLITVCACAGLVRGFGQTPSCSAASKFYIKDTINVTTFGASTVAGMNGFSFQPYLQQNFQYCYVGKVISITNKGIPGETTTQGLARFEKDILGRTGFLFILIGVNDAIQLANEPVPPGPATISATLRLAQQNMQKMINIASSHGLTTILGTVQNLDAGKNPSFKIVNRYIATINAEYKRLAVVNHIYLADINAGLGNNFNKYFQPDGIHPNAAGDKFIAYILFDVINFAIEKKLLEVGLDQNFPNPAKNKTTIGFSMSQAGNVDVELYSLTGAHAKTITQNSYNSGYHQVAVDLTDLSPGLYIYVMNIAGRQLSKKMLVIK